MNMYLSHITGRSFKGGDFDLALDRANVLTGENAGGKTRVLDAIQLLLLGNIPAFGEKPRDAFLALASGPVLTVEGTLTSTTHPIQTSAVRRKLYLVGDSVKTEFEAPSFLDDAKTPLAVMLDAQVYFALGSTDRVRYVYDNCPKPEGFDVNSVAARVRAVAPDYPAFEDILLKVDGRGRNFVDEIGQLVNDDWQKNKNYAGMMEDTIRGLHGLRAGEEAPETQVAQAQGRRGELERRLAELNEKKGLKIGAYTAVRSARVRRAEIDREVQHAAKDRDELVRLKEKLALVDSGLTAARITTEEEVQQAGVAASRAHDRRLQLMRDQQAEFHKIRPLEDELAALDGQEVCPYCGAAGVEWKKIRAAELAQKIDAIKRVVDGYVPKRLEADKVKEETAATYTRLTEEQRKRRDLEYTRGGVVNELGQIETRIARVEAREVERKNLAPDDPALEAAVDAIQGQINEAAAEARQLEQQIALAQGRGHELVRLADAEKKRDAAKADQEKGAKAGKELKAIKAEMVDAAFGPVLKRANQFFPGILKTPLEYNATKGEIGTRRAGLWVGHRTFSGTEKLLAYAAIQAALAQTAPVRIMILDELGKLTAQSAKWTAAAINIAMVRGHIDQFIGVDPERGALYEAATVTVDNKPRPDLAFKVQEIR